MNLDIQYIDTCLSCYVQDHCNGDDELLVGVPVDRSSRLYQVRDGLLQEIDQDTSEKLPEQITDAVIQKAVDEVFAGRHLFKSFNSDLDKASDDGETVFVWFRLTWDDDDC